MNREKNTIFVVVAAVIQWTEWNEHDIAHLNKSHSTFNEYINWFFFIYWFFFKSNNSNSITWQTVLQWIMKTKLTNTQMTIDKFFAVWLFWIVSFTWAIPVHMYTRIIQTDVVNLTSIRLKRIHKHIYFHSFETIDWRCCDRPFATLDSNNQLRDI